MLGNFSKQVNLISFFDFYPKLIIYIFKMGKSSKTFIQQLSGLEPRKNDLQQNTKRSFNKTKASSRLFTLKV